MSEQKKSNISVTNHQRITRIFQKIINSKSNIYIRATEKSPTMVKGVLKKLQPIRKDFEMVNALFVNGISNQGVNYLFDKKSVQLEFVMPSAKILGKSEILSLDKNSAYFKLPTMLTTIERRSNTRYNTNDNLTAFLNLSLWNQESKSLLSPPCFDHQLTTSNYLHVSNISQGGISVATRFPSILHDIKRGIIDENASIIFPMTPMISSPLIIRWVKKVKQRSESKEENETNQTTILIGCQFTSVSRDLKQQITLFTQKLLEQEAL